MARHWQELGFEDNLEWNESANEISRERGKKRGKEREEVVTYKQELNPGLKENVKWSERDRSR